MDGFLSRKRNGHSRRGRRFTASATSALALSLHRLPSASLALIESKYTPCLLLQGHSRALPGINVKPPSYHMLQIKRRSSMPPTIPSNSTWSNAEEFFTSTIRQIGRRLSFSNAVTPSADQDRVDMMDEAVKVPIRRHSKFKGLPIQGLSQTAVNTYGNEAVSAADMDQNRVVETVIDLMPDAVCAIDKEGIVKYANREFNSTMNTLGTDGHRSLLSCISASDRQKLFTALHSVFTDPSVDRSTIGECLTTTRTADGEVDLFYSWTICSDKSKKIVLAIGRHCSEVRSTDLLHKWSAHERTLDLPRPLTLLTSNGSKEQLSSTIYKTLALDSTIFEDETSEVSSNTPWANRSPSRSVRLPALSSKQPPTEAVVPFGATGGGLIELLVPAKTRGAAKSKRVYERLKDALAEIRELRDALELKRHFVRSVGHEIRTPLTVVLSGLALIEPDLVASHPSLTDVLAAMKSSCEVSIGLLNDLLAYEKVEGGILTLDARLADVAQLLTAALGLFRIQAAASDITLTVRLETDQQVMALVDTSKIGQVLRNLLSNAIKFTPSRGSVEAVLSLPSSDRVRIEVTDSGPGMTIEQQSLLFGRIVQFNPAELQNGQGTGIGLYMSKGVMDLHGGVIGVRSEGPNTGCTFFIELPLVSVSSPVVEDASHVTSVTGLSKTPDITSPVTSVCQRRVRVLIVDDGALCRKMIARQLTAMQCECVEADSGLSALEEYRSRITTGGDFDVILMDAQMPGMNGDEATEAIRLLGFTGKIFGVTGAASTKSRQHFLAHGADKVYLKPLSPEDMRAIIDEVSIALHA